MSSPSTEIKKPTIEKENRPPSRELVSIVEDGMMGELVYNKTLISPFQFAVWEGDLSVKKSLSINGETISPPRAARNVVEPGVVTLPTAAVPYGSQSSLVREVASFVHKYADVPEYWEDLITHYILMTWVYDRFSAVPYLRFLGEPGTGKSRLLMICSKLAYKSISAGGSTSVSPLFRLMEVYHGTLVLDEADYRYSELWSDLAKVLNQGYSRGMTVLRSQKVGDNYEAKGFDVFGPKIIANRSRFGDPALEQRCLTLQTQERDIRKEVPCQLPPGFYEEASCLRDKLLMWRFQNFHRINADESKLLDLDGRLTQIGTPIYSVASDEKFRSQFLEYLRNYASEQKASKPQALVVEALLRLKSKGKNTITVKEATEECNSVLRDRGADEDLTPKRIGSVLRSVGFEKQRTNVGYKINLEVHRKRLEQLAHDYGLAEDFHVADSEKRESEGGKGSRNIHATSPPAAREGGQAIVI
ncbi:MAG: hypothetical protein M3O09_10895 [Acidobacteriota bacterium]|nr:hypothetical protein [Acidobacteriota bacterium]